MRFIYLNSENIYPQDTHLIQGLRELGHTVVEISEKGISAHSHIITRAKEIVTSEDHIIVGYTSPLLAIRARFVFGNRIIFNAVFSQYEANIVSRGDVGHLFIKVFKWWLVDFISFHLSHIILLESNEQITYVQRLFFIRRKKLIRSFSGLNETEFFFDPRIEKNKDFTVVFRGRFLPESGILTVIKAAKILENSGITFLIIGHGFLYREFNALVAKLAPKNITHIHDKLPIDELRRFLLSSHISLGQLANHPRLKRTLPCKLFESLALKLPYLTARNKAVFEVLEDRVSCMTCNPGDADDLAQKILYLRDNPEIREKIAQAGYDVYKNRLTSKQLTAQVLTHII